jgi:hypothetical protein
VNVREEAETPDEVKEILFKYEELSLLSRGGEC